MTLSVCLIAWVYSRVSRYSVFAVDFVLMWGQRGYATKAKRGYAIKATPPKAVQAVELQATIIL